MSKKSSGKHRPLKHSAQNAAPFLKDGGDKVSAQVDHHPPAFSFERMQDGSGHSFNCCGDDDRLALVKRFFMLSRTDWTTIKLAHAKGLGSEPIPRGQIKKSIPNVVTPDVTSFLSLHYGLGKKRFIGYKVGQIFYVLWIDHNFKVYDHGP